MVNMLDSDIVVSYYVHFRTYTLEKGMDSFISRVKG